MKLLKVFREVKYSTGRNMKVPFDCYLAEPVTLSDSQLNDAMAEFKEIGLDRIYPDLTSLGELLEDKYFEPQLFQNLLKIEAHQYRLEALLIDDGSLPVNQWYAIDPRDVDEHFASVIEPVSAEGFRQYLAKVAQSPSARQAEFLKLAGEGEIQIDLVNDKPALVSVTHSVGPIPLEALEIMSSHFRSFTIHLAQKNSKLMKSAAFVRNKLAFVMTEANKIEGKQP